MNREDVIEQLTPLARDIFNTPELILSDELNATNMQNWTSLSFMQLLTAIEESFCIKYKMMDLLKLKDMGAVIDSIVSKVGK